MTIAVIFVPAAHIATYASQCFDYCAARGYEVAGVVHGDWAAAAAMLMSRTAGVLIVARGEHLDPNREPRVEVALPEESGPAGPSTRPASRLRRPRRI